MKNTVVRKIGDNQFTQVRVHDAPDEKSKACHVYSINDVINGDNEQSFCTVINFQKGPIKEVGVNGVNNEDLISIIIDRLQCFQNSDYKCRENAIALTKMEEALLWLNKRTKDRTLRGVEGTREV